MNPQYPIPNSTFSFSPLNPNPNFSNPHFNSIQSHPQPQSLLSNLPTCLSSLKTLLHSSNSTLQSLSSNFPPNFLPPNSLVQCPSNPNHWVPPSSLFHHSLNCPSPLHVGPLLDALKYPKTLDSNHGCKFVQPINDPTSELCFSIDDYIGIDSNFFYQGCHGVVSSINDDLTKRVFTIPRVLSVECSNFVGNVDVESDLFSGSSIRMLPSEMWVVEKDFEMWGDYPSEYSHSIIRALLGLKCVKESDLLIWLITNSPKFGVVIDIAMRDHMSVLFRVCLKAIVREATQSYENLLKSNENDNRQKFDPKSSRFKCPIMVEALRWLASQLSILYGEMNAKSFVIAMIGHLMRNSVSIALLIPLDRKMEQTFFVEKSREIVENKEDDKTNPRMFSRSIFVYQIAAGVAALHERSLLEERIRALRNPPPLSCYQRIIEHQYFSKKAEEERQKCPDYRPLIEHDSIISQQKDDQETTRLKTREELLAEERDYKRRRMSYRGKKHKRSAKEVMRDIIEEYMEAIEQTGSIGLTNGDERAMSKSKNVSTEKSSNFKTNHDLENVNKKHNSSPFGKEQKKNDSYNHEDHDDHMTNGDKFSWDYHSRSPSRERRHYSKEHKSHKRNEHFLEMDDNEGSRSQRRERKNDQSKERSTHRSSSSKRDKRKLESSDRHRWDKHENDERGKIGMKKFSDRYDPTEDDQFFDS